MCNNSAGFVFGILFKLFPNIMRKLTMSPFHCFVRQALRRCCCILLQLLFHSRNEFFIFFFVLVMMALCLTDFNNCSTACYYFWSVSICQTLCAMAIRFRSIFFHKFVLIVRTLGKQQQNQSH